MNVLSVDEHMVSVEKWMENTTRMKRQNIKTLNVYM